MASLLRPGDVGHCPKMRPPSAVVQYSRDINNFWWDFSWSTGIEGYKHEPKAPRCATFQANKALPMSENKAFLESSLGYGQEFFKFRKVQELLHFRNTVATQKWACILKNLRKSFLQGRKNRNNNSPAPHAIPPRSGFWLAWLEKNYVYVPNGTPGKL